MEDGKMLKSLIGPALKKRLIANYVVKVNEKCMTCKLSQVACGTCKWYTKALEIQEQLESL